MVNIFCTNKLAAYLPQIEKNLVSSTYHNNWSGQLVVVNRRNCLYFIHKRTLYSVLLLDFKKKDFKIIDKLFFEGLIAQLQLDELNRPELNAYLRENFTEVKFYKTDNDQSTLGTMRDDLMRLKATIEDRVDKFEAAKDFMKYAMNEIPIGTRKYQSAKKIMAAELKLLVP
jgi:hypothetical protein